jgi:hypothetical protein
MKVTATPSSAISPILMLHRFLVLLLLILPASLGIAQADDPSVLPDDPPAATPAPQQPVEDKRVFGVLPNNRTTEESNPFQPLTVKQKLAIAAKDSFDWPSYVTGAGFAGLYQLENSNPSWGQGVAGYARRYASASGDQIIGNMMTEGFIPALGHQDPRYFRLGQGSTMHRLLYSIEQIVVAKMDTGQRTFNFSEWGGNAAAAAISNLYYPAASRTASNNLEKLFISCGTDTFSNVAKEFWPDIKRYFHNRKERRDQQKAGN